MAAMVGKARKAMTMAQREGAKAPKTNGTPTSDTKKPGDIIAIDQRQQQALRVLMGHLSQIKSRIADIEIEKAQLVAAALDKNRELKTTCENIVNGEGLQRKGAYSLDLATMTLRLEE
jgi:hypothetical protein